MLRIFIGTDRRQPVAASVLQSSLYETSSVPLAITQLRLPSLPCTRKGTTEFTYSRFLVPYLSDYEGWSLFLDADMVVQADIKELFDLRDKNFDVMLVKNKQRFEWASLMLFNNEKCKDLNPESIAEGEPAMFDWTGKVGELPAEWNHLIGYDEPKAAKLIHYTLGIPMFPECVGAGGEPEWFAAYHQMLQNPSWLELMGQSRHAPLILDEIKHRWQTFQNSSMS